VAAAGKKVTDDDSVAGHNLNMTSLDTVYFRDNASLANTADVRKRTSNDQAF
jgi:hypothetical protein